MRINNGNYRGPLFGRCVGSSNDIQVSSNNYFSKVYQSSTMDKITYLKFEDNTGYQWPELGSNSFTMVNTPGRLIYIEVATSDDGQSIIGLKFGFLC